VHVYDMKFGLDWCELTAIAEARLKGRGGGRVGCGRVRGGSNRASKAVSNNPRRALFDVMNIYRLQCGMRANLSNSRGQSAGRHVCCSTGVFVSCRPCTWPAPRLSKLQQPLTTRVASKL